jgi:Family of unknown function (DUF6338)
MADVVFDANAVGQVVTYVAPGFLTYVGYRLRYPGPNRPPGEVLIVSVVLSLPLVALVTAALPGAQKPTQLGYVAVLLGVGLVVGYIASLVRGRPRTKRLLAKLGYRLEAEGSIYAQTLKHMSDEATVTVELKDGRRVSGCPRNGPQHKDDGINELYLVYADAQGADDAWQPIDGAGLIVPLSEVSNVVLSEEPTGAPKGEDVPAASG